MHRTVPVAALVAALAALAPARAAAHEGDRALGTVASVTAERIVVKARDGHEVAFKLTPQTKITRGKEAARPGDVRPGERAVVHGRRAGGEVEAVEVRLGAPARPAPKR